MQPTPPRFPLIITARSKGNAAIASKDYAAAVTSYGQALALCPTGPTSHLYYSNRAAAYLYLLEFKKAELDSLQAIRLDPTFAKVYARLGFARSKLDDWEGSKAAYVKAKELGADVNKELAKVVDELKDRHADVYLSTAALESRTTRVTAPPRETKHQNDRLHVDSGGGVPDLVP